MLGKKWRMGLALALAIACCGARTRAQGEGKTLGQILAEEQVPADAGKLANLEKTVTSGAELNDGERFVIAYYVREASDRLVPPMFIDSYDRSKGEWRSAQLADANAPVHGVDADCFGSVLAITALGRKLIVETHLSPSASCSLILSPELKLEAKIGGWVVGRLGEEGLIYHRNEVHFAPVHSVEIALYDVRTKRDVTIFPRKPESAVRRARIEELKEFYKTHEEWCRKWNDCDPEEFDSELEEGVKTNEVEQALAFVISYEQIQRYPKDDAKPSGPKDVVYVYRWVNDESRMEYREMLWSEVRERAGNVPTERLVEPAILEKIFGEKAK